MTAVGTYPSDHYGGSGLPDVESRFPILQPIWSHAHSLSWIRKFSSGMLVCMNARQRRFDALARRYADDLFRFAVWLCGDATQANDLVQETFMRAWKALDSLRDADAAKGWLIAILRREHARTFERKIPPQHDIDDVVVAEEKELTPEERAERNLLRRAMLDLEVKYREPLVLQVVMGLSIAEIAEQLELTESAVMTRVFRAREQLKARLRSDDGQRGKVHELS